ncbi:bacteriocin fulvocin C-related protein [Myxococcus xanthus]|nr:bacteriocin fulvocin C-related protein [Myxococcus xanthus]
MLLKIKIAMLLSPMIIGAFIVGFPTTAAAGDDCTETQAQIQAWIEENEGILPTTLEEVSRHPMAYRRAILVALPAEQKAALWKEHTRQYMASHPQMSAKQVAVLEMVLATISPQFYTEGVTPEVRRVQAAVKAAFSPEEARLIVATLGPPETPAAEASLAPLCECSRVDQWCGSFRCRAYSCRQQSGCGWWGGERCDGLCG